MANPTLLSVPLCRDAEKNTIPVTDNGTTGKFSEQYGWQGINSLPLSAGGKAVERLDFNGVLALLGGIDYMTQRGYTFEYDNTLPYVAGCIVVDPLDGKTYRCINDVPIGASNPSNDPINWIPYDIADYVGGALRSKAYNVGDTSTLVGIPAGYFLECTTAGTTATNAPTFSQPVTAGQTITDGTVVWTVRKCFPTSGGTMNGNITMPSNGRIFMADNTSTLQLWAGPQHYTGGSLLLKGRSASENAGMTSLRAYLDESNDSILNCYPDGRLTWDTNDLGGSAIVAKLLSGNGYVKRASGEIIQWGREDSVTMSGTITYPISFKNTIRVVATIFCDGTAASGVVSISQFTTTNFTWHLTSSSHMRGIVWVAIGY